MPTPDLRLANDLRLACQRISRRIRYESALEIAPHQYSVLIQVLDGPMTPRAIADRERVSAPSMTRTVNGLEAHGLVTRRPHPDDGRQVLVELTDAGRELVDRTRARRDSWMTRALLDLEPEERELLRAAASTLQKIAR